MDAQRVVCPRCGSPVGVDASACMRCGAVLAPGMTPTGGGGAPREQMSYTQKYAGTAYGRPLAPPTPVPAARPERRPMLRPLRIGVTVVGLFYLLPAVFVMVGALMILSGRSGIVGGQVLPEDLVAPLRPGALFAFVQQLIWALIGLKLVLAPGRLSLGCAGLGGLIGLLAFGMLALQTNGGPALLTGLLAVEAIVYAFVTVASFAAFNDVG
jgi:hypothetical protein